MNHPHPLLGCNCEPCETARIKAHPPNAIINCAKCGENVMIWLGHAPLDDLYHRVAKELGKTVCPACINASFDAEIDSIRRNTP